MPTGANPTKVTAIFKSIPPTTGSAALAEVVGEKQKEIQSNNNKLPAASHSLCFTHPKSIPR